MPGCMKDNENQYLHDHMYCKYHKMVFDDKQCIRCGTEQIQIQKFWVRITQGIILEKYGEDIRTYYQKYSIDIFDKKKQTQEPTWEFEIEQETNEVIEEENQKAQIISEIKEILKIQNESST